MRSPAIAWKSHEAIELTVGWGWNLIRPLRGTLPEDYPDFSCRIIPIDRSGMTAKLPWGVTIPLRPFFGIMAVAPPSQYGLCSSVEPRAFGGNMDNKELLAGTSVHFPVFVPGANFSAGDGHAVQGDGEVCLTALETCLKGTFEFILHKGKGLELPRAVTPTHLIAMGFDTDPRRCRQAGPARDDTLAGRNERLEFGGGLSSAASRATCA